MTRSNLACSEKGFHDCVGGCNGCIDFDNSDNNGLETTVDYLNEIYESNDFQSYGASRADFWALGAWVALTSAVRTYNSKTSGDL